MHWNNNDGGGWWWVFMVLMMLAFWGGLIWLVVTLIRSGSGSSTGPTAPSSFEPPRQSPEDILHERLARGEIDLEEYDQRLDALKSKRSP